MTGPDADQPQEPPAAVAPPRPRLRGRLHQAAFWVVLALGPVLVTRAEGAGPRVAAAVYVVSLAALFGVSALYHRVDWPLTRRAVMRRLDHTMIFVLIAGTYTVVAGLGLPRATAVVVVALVWAGAAAGAALQLLRPQTPQWVAAVVYVGLGWVALGVIPALREALTPGAFWLLVVGGLLYSVGALVYATRRPNPAPRTFGYHEVFHALTIAAAGCHFSTAWTLVA